MNLFMIKIQINYFLISDIIIDTTNKSLPFILTYIDNYPVDIKHYLITILYKDVKNGDKPDDVFSKSIFKYFLNFVSDYVGKDPSYITPYDICVSICFSEELYYLVGKKVPNFPYYDNILFDASIEHVFGNNLKQDFKQALTDYLKYSLSMCHQLSYEEFRDKVYRNSNCKQIARLNLAGQFLIIICNTVKENFQSTFGNAWESKFNFLALVNVLNNINIK